MLQLRVVKKCRTKLSCSSACNQVSNLLRTKLAKGLSLSITATAGKHGLRLADNFTVRVSERGFSERSGYFTHVWLPQIPSSENSCAPCTGSEFSKHWHCSMRELLTAFITRSETGIVVLVRFLARTLPIERVARMNNHCPL